MRLKVWNDSGKPGTSQLTIKRFLAEADEEMYLLCRQQLNEYPIHPSSSNGFHDKSTWSLSQYRANPKPDTAVNHQHGELVEIKQPLQITLRNWHSHWKDLERSGKTGKIWKDYKLWSTRTCMLGITATSLSNFSTWLSVTLYNCWPFFSLDLKTPSAVKSKMNIGKMT